MNRSSVLLVLAVLSGCASVQPVTRTTYEPRKESIEHRVDTSYTLGSPAQAYVGERMLRIQDYYVKTTESESNSISLNPTEDFELKIPPFMTISVSKSDTAIVKGKTEKNGMTYRVISLPGPAAGILGFLIDEDGAFEGSAINSMGAKMGWTYTPKPTTVHFVPEPSSTHIDMSKGFTNFELVYGGTSGGSFQVLYREYTREDLARPAFTQTLVYEKGIGSVRFRNIQLSVEEASNEKIIFTVLADGT